MSGAAAVPGRNIILGLLTLIIHRRGRVGRFASLATPTSGFSS